MLPNAARKILTIEHPTTTVKITPVANGLTAHTVTAVRGANSTAPVVGSHGSTQRVLHRRLTEDHISNVGVIAQCSSAMDMACSITTALNRGGAM